MPGVCPPIFFSQGIPFGYSFDFCLREVKDIPEFFFKEEDFFDRGSFIDFDHLRYEEVFFFGPYVSKDPISSPRVLHDGRPSVLL